MQDAGDVWQVLKLQVQTHHVWNLIILLYWLYNSRKIIEPRSASMFSCRMVYNRTKLRLWMLRLFPSVKRLAQCFVYECAVNCSACYIVIISACEGIIL